MQGCEMTSWSVAGKLNEDTDGLQEIMVIARNGGKHGPAFVLHRGAYDSPG